MLQFKKHLKYNQNLKKIDNLPTTSKYGHSGTLASSTFCVFWPEVEYKSFEEQPISGPLINSSSNPKSLWKLFRGAFLFHGFDAGIGAGTKGLLLIDNLAGGFGGVLEAVETYKLKDWC